MREIRCRAARTIFKTTRLRNRAILILPVRGWPEIYRQILSTPGRNTTSSVSESSGQTECLPDPIQTAIHLAELVPERRFNLQLAFREITTHSLEKTRVLIWLV